MTKKSNYQSPIQDSGLIFVKPWVTPLRPFKIVTHRIKKMNDALKK